MFGAQFDVINNLISYIPEITKNLGFLDKVKKDYTIENLSIRKRQFRSTQRLFRAVLKGFPLIHIDAGINGSLQIATTEINLLIGNFAERLAFMDEDEDGDEDEEINVPPKKLSKEGLNRKAIQFIKDIQNQLSLLITYLAGLANVDPIISYKIDIRFPLKLLIDEKATKIFSDINQTLMSKFENYKFIKANLLRFECISDDLEHTFMIDNKSKVISYKAELESNMSNFDILEGIKNSYKITKEMLANLMK